MFTQLLAKSSAKQTASSLYRAASDQARTEALYTQMGTPDSVEGRFELLTMHVILLIERLEGETGPAAETRQALFDAYVSNLDGALREMGVGDLAVGKRMRKLGEAFYGRARAFQAAFEQLPDQTDLKELLARTALQARPETSPDGLATYAVRCREGLRGCDSASLMSGRPVWGV